MYLGETYPTLVSRCWLLRAVYMEHGSWVTEKLPNSGGLPILLHTTHQAPSVSAKTIGVKSLQSRTHVTPLNPQAVSHRQGQYVPRSGLTDLVSGLLLFTWSVANRRKAVEFIPFVINHSSGPMSLSWCCKAGLKTASGTNACHFCKLDRASSLPIFLVHLSIHAAIGLAVNILRYSSY